MKTYLKKNKGLFLLPLGLIPFLIVIFYILGGGKGEIQEKQRNAQTSNGANYILPEAEKSIDILDKMEAYQQQGNGKEGMNRSVWNAGSASKTMQYANDSTFAELSNLAHQNHGLPENLLAHIKQKEQEIRGELDGQRQSTGSKKADKRKSSFKPKQKRNPDEPKPVFQTTGIEELDKVFDENIELNRQNDSLKFYLEQSQKQIALIEQKRNAGFTLDKKQYSDFDGDEDNNSLIKAEVYENTTVLNGNRVKLRLLEDTWVNEKKVSKNTFIYGICKIKNERLLIEITQLPVRNSFIPVNLIIYDLDGLPGLYVPDNVARKVTQEVGASTNTSSIMGVSNNPLTYVGIRAADRTAQTLLKRVRLKKVTVKKNTLVYLINQQ